MQLHPLRHNVVLLAAFLAGGVAMQVALGHVRMYGLLPVVGVLIGLNLRYNRLSERGRTRIDERYDRIIQSGALVGFVAMLYATVGYAFYVSMTDGIAVSRGNGTAFGRRSRLHRPRVRILLAFAHGLQLEWGLTTTRRENELRLYRGKHELVQACPRPTAARECAAGPSAPCS
jgi:hypothetical protein